MEEQEQKVLGVDLSIASKEMIEALLAEAADPGTYEDILKAGAQRPEIIKLLLENPDTPENIKEEAAKLLQVPVKAFSAVEKIEETPEEHAQTMLQKVQNLTVSERRLLAMRGGREIRSILLKDTNKQIILSVLTNPKITESEVEIFAHSRSIPDDALRAITKNRDWMKSYGVLLAVITNPKTPAGIAIPLLNGLKLRDLAAIEKNKNVAEALRTAAKKLVQSRKPH
ncbi:MAG: hypothetical protein EPN94_04490 [Nitrospirae bacterium]|nr:MAG: hypothetical protein EPN94_04490 [Nitrospirota bacterium]